MVVLLIMKIPPQLIVYILSYAWIGKLIPSLLDNYHDIKPKNLVKLIHKIIAILYIYQHSKFKVTTKVSYLFDWKTFI